MKSLTISDELYDRLIAQATHLFGPEQVITRLLEIAAGLNLEPTTTQIRSAQLANGAQQGPNTALASLAQSDQKQGLKLSLRAHKGEPTQRETYMRAILAILGSGASRQRTKDMKRLVLKRLQGVLKEIDFEPVPSRETDVRWWNSARFARNELVKLGYLRSDSRVGTWELSEKGLPIARKLAVNVDDPTVTF